MIGFAGVVRFDGAPVAADDEHRWKFGLAGPAHVSMRAQPSALFACEGRRESPHGSPLDLPDGTLLIADARLDDPVGLAGRLGMSPANSDAALAAAAWERWGADAIEHLLGDVALAHWDAADRTLTLARDPIGARSLYYVCLGPELIFASSIEILLAHPRVPRDLDDLGLADLLASGGTDRERTLYRAIHRVPPGGMRTFGPDRDAVRHWWSLDRIAPVRFARDEDYVDAARALFDRAVASRLPAEGRVAAMLSGGFDSAAIVATAARQLGERPLNAYTRVAGGPHPYAGLDERSHAASVAAMYPNVAWTVIDDAPDARPGPPADWDAVMRGHPRLASFNLGWYDPVHAAAEAAGADVLLVGNAGNLVLSGTGQQLLTELASAGKWGSLFRTVRQLARYEGVSLGRAAKTYLPAAVEPRRMRRWRLSRRQGGASPWLEYSLASRDFLAAVGFEARVARAGVELPFTPRGTGREARYRLLMRQGARDSDDYFRRRRRFIKLDPYEDRRLIEFSLGVPEDQYLKDGIRRSLARRVLADRLPAALLAEKRRGRQSPEWYAIASLHRDRLAEMVETLARSPLASRVLDVPRIRALFESWPADAEAARREERRYGSTLYRAIVIGDFLSRWEAPR